MWQGRSSNWFPQRQIVLAAGVLWMAIGVCGCGSPDSQPGQVPAQVEQAERAGQAEQPKQPALSDQTAAEPAGGERPAAAKAGALSAREVLERMVQVYRQAASYGDQGRIHIQGEMDGRRFDQEADYLLAFQRPNKLRLQAYQGIIVCDGEHLWAYVTTLANQVVRRPAPDRMKLSALLFDPLLAGAMAQPWTQVYSLLPVQAVLLLADDPLTTLLRGARAMQRIESAAIGPASCYRVRVVRPDGEVVFWIDEESFLLRRVEFPTVEVNRMVAQGRLRDFSLVADFGSAQLDRPIDPNAFAFVMPEEAELVEQFLPPDYRLLGKPVPEFTFVDLEGNSITPESLAGKVSVLDFWATWCMPCRDSLPELDKVCRQLNAEKRLAVWAVSVDGPSVSDEELKKTFQQLGVKLPIARDPQQFAGKSFFVSAIPATVIVGSQGKVQHLESGFHPQYASQLTSVLGKLLAGQDVYQEKLDEFRAQSKRVVEWLAEKAKKDSYWGPLAIDVPPATEIAPRSEPQKLRMRLLWQCRDLQLPGNILAVGGPQGTERILVIDQDAAIAELDSDGRLVARHPLPVRPGQPVQFLRAGRTAGGTRWYVAAANGGQQLHLLNERLEPVLAYPPDADKFPHAGIADVQFGDLDNDGTPEICVGYWGDVGVQGVSLEGKRIWRNRQLSQVQRVAVLGLDSRGQRNLLCINYLGNLGLIDAQGALLTEITVPERPLDWIVSADLDGDGQMELCGLSPDKDGRHVAIGLDLHGKLLWTVPLPPGMHEYAVEPVVAGRLLPDRPGCWLLAGPDGSIHVVSAAGQLIDKFNYGAALTGLAIAQIAGHPVLLVATPDRVDAWQVEGLRP